MRQWGSRARSKTAESKNEGRSRGELHDRTFLRRRSSVYRQSALFSGHSVLRPTPDGVVFGLFGFTVVPPPPAADAPGTALSDGPGGFRPGGLNEEDDPGVTGVACGKGVAGCRPVAGGIGVAGAIPDGLEPGVLGAVDVRPDGPVVGPGDGNADAGGWAGGAFPGGGDCRGAVAGGAACGAGDPGTGVTVPAPEVCAAPEPAAITVRAAVARRHRIVRIDRR